MLPNEIGLVDIDTLVAFQTTFHIGMVEFRFVLRNRVNVVYFRRHHLSLAFLHYGQQEVLVMPRLFCLLQCAGCLLDVKRLDFDAHVRTTVSANPNPCRLLPMKTMLSFHHQSKASFLPTNYHDALCRFENM
jgi:hypothetical protein